MKYLLILILLLTSPLIAFQPPLNPSASYISQTTLNVLPDQTQTKLGEWVASDTATYDLNIKLWNPQLGVSEVFPVTLKVTKNQDAGTQHQASLTSNEAEIATTSQTLSLTSGDKVEVFATQSVGHALTLQAYIWFVKQE